MQQSVGEEEFVSSESNALSHNCHVLLTLKQDSLAKHQLVSRSGNKKNGPRRKRRKKRATSVCLECTARHSSSLFDGGSLFSDSPTLKKFKHSEGRNEGTESLMDQKKGLKLFNLK